MNILELTLLVSNISYECNEWISRVKKDDNFNLEYYYCNIININSIKFIRDANLDMNIRYKQDQGLCNICTLKTSNYLIIAFSGLDNFSQVLNILDYFLIYNEMLECNIHRGFNYIMNNLLDEVRLIIDVYNCKNVLFTGHSLGGAIAKLMCLFFNKVKSCNFNCITYSCPLIGDETCIKKFNEYVKTTDNFLSADDFLVDLPYFRGSNLDTSHFIESSSIKKKNKIQLNYFKNILNFSSTTHRLNYLYRNLILNKKNLFFLNDKKYIKDIFSFKEYLKNQEKYIN